MARSVPVELPKIRLGSTGLVAMKYRGFNLLADYKGLATGAIYNFGMERPRGYVDARDVPSLLEIVEDTWWVFEILDGNRS